MAWVVDSCVLLDIRMRDADFGLASAHCLAAHLSDGLVIAPITYVELAPAFKGDALMQNAFLEQAGIEWSNSWTRSDTEAAYQLWAVHVQKKRAGQGNKRPVADVFIEAFAKRFQGLITRNPKHFTTIPLIVPART
jgi:predicted nucleic acid-binding protein